MNIGIIGNGYVGKATQQFRGWNLRTLVYDIRPEGCIPLGTTLADLSVCHVVFVCVPTPMESSGKCHLSLVESVVHDLKQVIDTSKTFIVIRSTVPPGTCDRLGCYFMPEFLTEKNYIQDVIDCKYWIVGTLDDENKERFKETIQRMFCYAVEEDLIKSSQVVFQTNKEAEMVKYFRNCYLSTKVSFCNEMEEFCRLKGIEYEAVRKAATLDDRIGPSHSCVPGHDGKRGFGGTCFPKDTNSLLYEMKQVGMTSYILQSAVDRNQKVDRNEQDWNDNKGRAVV